MKESLEKTTHDLDFARGELQEALGKSNAVEGIIILGLIERVTYLSRDVKNLINAREVDAK